MLTFGATNRMWMHQLCFSAVAHPTQKFTHRLVFGGARAALLSHGLDVTSTATSAGGRRATSAPAGTGPELAVAIRLDAAWPTAGPIALMTEVALAPTCDDRFNRLFVLRDLRAQLLRRGVVIGSIEQTAGGAEGDIAIRIRVV